MGQKKKETLQKTVAQTIQSVCDEVCNNFCKYRNTADEEMLCDYIRDGKPCPLDRLQ